MKEEAGVGRRRDDPSLLNTILEKQEKLHHIRDLNTLLDSLLYETRALTGADAGSIFLVGGKKLLFSYVQNDSLFKSDFLSNKYIYTNNEIDIDERSIAGYVAFTGKPLLIDDAYAIDTTYPFSFNPYFDQISSYRTVSMLIVPIRTSKNDMVGVLELINRRGAAGSRSRSRRTRSSISRSSPSTRGSPSNGRCSCATSSSRWSAPPSCGTRKRRSPMSAASAPTRWSCTRNGRKSTRSPGKK